MYPVRVCSLFWVVFSRKRNRDGILKCVIDTVWINIPKSLLDYILKIWKNLNSFHFGKIIKQKLFTLLNEITYLLGKLLTTWRRTRDVGDRFDLKTVTNKNKLSILDEQNWRLQIEKCWRITFQSLLWWVQYFWIWNHALFFGSYIWSRARVSLVSFRVIEISCAWYF